MKMNKYLVGVVVVLVVVLVGVVAWKAFGEKETYTAVYLKTGDLYFGKLVRFPYFGLEQPYLITANQDGSPSIQRFKNVFWGPEDVLKLNRDEVVWYTNLSSTSQLAKVFTENPELAAPQGQQQQQVQQAPQQQQQVEAPKQ
jgi:hypothetical protein